MGQATSVSSQKITASKILEQLKLIHENQQPPWVLYPEVKSGPSWGQGGKQLFILDAVAIKKSWGSPCIYGYEIKVSRSDFFRGKDTALREYMKYCHKFSFVCPPNVVQLDELPGDVGLIYYSPEHNTLFTKRRAMYRKIDLQSPEVMGMLYYLVLYRAGKG